MSNIREDKGYTYGINSWVLPSLEENCIIIQCVTDNSHVAAVLDEINNEIKRLASEPMEDSELESVRQTMHSGQLATLDSPFTILDAYIVEKAMDIPAEANFTAMQRTALNATPKQIMETTARYLLQSPRCIALAGNPLL